MARKYFPDCHSLKNIMLVHLWERDIMRKSISVSTSVRVSARISEYEKVCENMHTYDNVSARVCVCVREHSLDPP